jgi:hypothetical protein
VERWNEMRKRTARLNATLAPGSTLTLDASLGYAGGPTRLSPEGGLGGRIGTTANANPLGLPAPGATRRVAASRAASPRSTT